MPRFCPNCGSEVETSWKVCQKCGNTLDFEVPSQPTPQPYVAPGAPPYGAQPQYPQGYQQYPTYQKAPKSNANQKGTYSLIFGVIGLLCCAIIFGPLAIIYGSKGLKEDQNKTMSQIGIVLGIIDFVCFIISIVMMMTILSSSYYY